MTLPKLILTLAVTLVVRPHLAWGANHFIRAGAPGVNNDGSDWSHAYAALPNTFLRGDTYYIATGNYADAVLATPERGGDLITLVGATTLNHGSSTGWLNSYSVCSQEGGTQAQFPNGWEVSTGYWTVDGACGGGSQNNGTMEGYGFRTRSDATGSSGLAFTFTQDVSGMTISHYEIDGVSATSLPASSNAPEGMLCNGACSYNGLLDHLYIHDIKGAGFLMAGNVTLQYSYLARNRTTAGAHAEAWSYRGGTAKIRWNIFEDMRGTGQFVQLYGTGINHEVYGNVFRLVQGECSTECGSSAISGG